LPPQSLETLLSKSSFLFPPVRMPRRHFSAFLCEFSLQGLLGQRQVVVDVVQSSSAGARSTDTAVCLFAATVADAGADKSAHEFSLVACVFDHTHYFEVPVGLFEREEGDVICYLLGNGQDGTMRSLRRGQERQARPDDIFRVDRRNEQSQIVILDIVGKIGVRNSASRQVEEESTIIHLPEVGSLIIILYPYNQQKASDNSTILSLLSTTTPAFRRGICPLVGVEGREIVVCKIEDTGNAKAWSCLGDRLPILAIQHSRYSKQEEFSVLGQAIPPSCKSIRPGVKTKKNAIPRGNAIYLYFFMSAALETYRVLSTRDAHSVRLGHGVGDGGRRRICAEDGETRAGVHHRGGLCGNFCSRHGLHGGVLDEAGLEVLMRGVGDERSVGTGGGDTLLLSGCESASHARETEARAVDDVFWRRLGKASTRVSIQRNILSVGCCFSESDGNGKDNGARCTRPSNSACKSDGRATSDLLTSSRRCELDVGDGNSCQSG
ncbi:X-Pro dipeptidase, partial [Aureobasidium melanogenum]